jgi:hypothetical protein
MRWAGKFIEVAVFCGITAVRVAVAEPLPRVLAPFFSPPAEFAKDTPGYRSMLQRKGGGVIDSQSEWSLRRKELRGEWHALMGKWPEIISKPKVEILATVYRGEIVQHQVRFRWTPREKTTGYLLIPEGEGKRPAVLTVYYEPETAIGRGKEHRDFAIQLAERGFVTLSIGTTEASKAGTYGLYWPSLEKAEIQPLSMLGYAAANAWQVLASRAEVDAERIGIVGHSFGGKWAMFASCLYDKFACAVWSDPGIVFDTRSSVNYWEPWYLGYHPKPWRKRGVITEAHPARGLYPKLVESGRDLHELHALMPPRPFLVSGGSEDPPARWRALNQTVAINEMLGVRNGVAMHNRAGHAPTPGSNEVVCRFFEWALAK